MDRRTDRRKFLKAGAAAGLSISGSRLNACPQKGDSDSLRESGRNIPIADECDVVVCGAGPAGVSAAIASARAGAQTRLIEVNGCLGGIWTAGLLCVILDFDNKPGLMEEYEQRLDERSVGMRYDRGHLIYDPEVMKLILEDMCVDAGVRVRLHTRIVAALKDDANRLQAVITDSKSGRQAVRAKVFVDATGDGDLASLAGCEFEYGNAEGGEGQPMSLIAMVAGLAADEVAMFVRGLAEPRGERSPKKRLLEELRRAGVEPSYSSPSLFYLPGHLMCMVVNHEYRVRGTNADDVTAATLRGRAEIHRCVDGLRGLGGIWKNIQLVTVAEHIGVREGRRVKGLYEITYQDLIEGRRHDDAVCQVRFGVDVHSPNPEKSRGFDHGAVRAKPYDIPYRSLIARDAQGLLLAGRCISGDFIAHSSYRVTGNSVATGQAAGTAAALAAQTGRLPKDLPWQEVERAVVS